MSTRLPEQVASLEHLVPEWSIEDGHARYVKRVNSSMAQIRAFYDEVFPHAEAAVAYQDHTYRPLIELLRIRHCPDRFDYGARYLDRDLPADLRAEVEALALPGTLDEVEAFQVRAQALFEVTLAELAQPG